MINQTARLFCKAVLIRIFNPLNLFMRNWSNSVSLVITIRVGWSSRIRSPVRLKFYCPLNIDTDYRAHQKTSHLTRMLVRRSHLQDDCRFSLGVKVNNVNLPALHHSIFRARCLIPQTDYRNLTFLLLYARSLRKLNYFVLYTLWRCNCNLRKVQVAILICQ